MSRDAETRETHVMEFPVYWRTEVAFGGDRRQQGRVVRSEKKNKRDRGMEGRVREKKEKKKERETKKKKTERGGREG